MWKLHLVATAAVYEWSVHPGSKIFLMHHTTNSSRFYRLQMP